MRTQRLIIIGLLIIIAIGRIMPMTLLPEPGDPWYLPYTTMWFFAAGVIFFPSGLVSEAVGISFTGPAYLFVDAAWLIILCLMIYFRSFRAAETEDNKE